MKPEWSELTKKGIKVHYFRLKDELDGLKNTGEPNFIKGRIVGTIVYKKCSFDGEKIPYGICVVSKKDKNVKKIGRSIAFQRFKKACEGFTKEMTSNPLTTLINHPINRYSANGSMNEIQQIINKLRNAKQN